MPIAAVVDFRQTGKPRSVRLAYADHAKGAMWPLRMPLESFHFIPKTLKRLRVALASASRLFTGCGALSMPIVWPGATTSEHLRTPDRRVLRRARPASVHPSRTDRSLFHTCHLAHQRRQRRHRTANRARGNRGDRLDLLRVARSSMISPTVMLPSPIGPGEYNMTMNDIPSSVTPSFAPLSMRIVTAALQSPSVGGAARFEVMQGHRNAQLHVSMYSPLTCQPAMIVSP